MSIQRIYNRTLLLSGVAIASAACWGLGIVMSRAALDALPPFTLLMVQLTASVSFLALVLGLRGQLPRLSVQNLHAGLPGLLEPGLAYVFGVVGLSLTTASNMSLIAAIEPIFVIGLAWIFLRERVTRRIAFLAPIAVIGVVLVSTSGRAAMQQGAIQGDILVLLGTVAAAAYVVASSRLLSDREPLLLTFVQQVIGLLAVSIVWLTASLLQFPMAALVPVSLQVSVLAVVSGVVQFGLAFWLYLIALQGLPITSAAFYLTLIPLFGVAGAFLFLGEQFTISQIAGAVCILSTVMFLSVSEQKDDSEPSNKDA